MISNNVVRASFDAIVKYVRQLNFLGPVNRAIEKLLLKNRKMAPYKRKAIDQDVQAVVEHLVDKLGSTWAVAKQARIQKDSILVNPARSPRPWQAVAALGQSAAYSAWVRGHIATKVTWM